MTQPGEEFSVTVMAGGLALPGDLGIPEAARGIVIFAHGSGSSRLSPRNRYVAAQLRQGGIGTLLFDLLTEEEDQDYERRFDIALLTQRLTGATRWLMATPWADGKGIGYFGASTGSAAALLAAAELGPAIRAVVSRGGRPDMAVSGLPRVQAPTLLIVGGADREVLALNQRAFALLTTTKELAVVPHATHLFEEPGTLEAVARLAREWFLRYLGDEKPSDPSP